MENLTSLIGRQWIGSQEDFSINTDLTKVSAIEDSHCKRCGAMVNAKLPNGKRYCRSCIELGRIVEGDILIRNEQEVVFPKDKRQLTWNGKLTPLQEKISQKLVENFINKKNTLIYAVTGAGKTEMLFALINQSLSWGQRCCIASPRIDVVNELYPRFKAAFNKTKIGKYHGQEYVDPGLEQLTICTTHQLLKFYHAFDLLVIDETDSFPYVENNTLHFAAKNALKIAGVQVYLTATPTKDLLADVKVGKIEILQLKRRFHGGKLPLPKEKMFLRPFLSKGKIHPKLLKEIIAVTKKGHPLLLFVPRIEQIPLYLSALKQVEQLRQIKIAGVYAGDKERLEKVQQFRNQKLQILVTTTILERGVTFKHVWVIIVQADDKIYTASSLVQIAGRVGRAKNDTDGLVLFCYHKYTSQLRKASQQIKELNR